MKHIHGFLASRPLWIKEQFGITQFEFPTVDLSMFSPKDIPTNIRLGHQVEHIFHQLIAYDTTYEVVTHNLPLRRNKITLGELDFILRHQTTQQLLHVELTYKFYILDPSIIEPIQRAMGPNRRDMFFRKMEKTRDHQFPLLFSKEAMNLLSKLNVDASKCVQQCCFLAQLFVPYSSDVMSVYPLNSECIVGYWMTQSHFKQSPFTAYEFYLPRKHEWLQTPHLNVAWLPHDEALIEVNARHLNKHAPMIWIKSNIDPLEKAFVVWWK
ncbi:MAG: DUF1853 family protein [Bacteroidetes bacterium]|nr:DUF1853 family protein [Bacteroidota bacterium]